MEKEDIEFKIELIDMEMNSNKEIYDFSKKTNSILLILYIVTILSVIIFTLDKNNFNVLQILTLSFLSCAFYDLINSIRKNKKEFISKDIKLRVDKMYYQSILKRGRVK